MPTAFYRHFESMDALGVELVDECMRPLRQMIRDARRGVAGHGDIITEHGRDPGATGARRIPTSSGS